MSARSDKQPKSGIFARKSFREKNRAPMVSSMVVFTLSAFLAGAVVLSIVTTVPELARAPGEITTLGRAHQVESINEGIVRTVHVREGQTVAAGQVLASLQSPELDRNIRFVTQQKQALTSRITTLESILSYLDEPDASSDRDGTAPADVRDYARSRVWLHDLQKEIARGRAQSLREIITELEEAQRLMAGRVKEKEASVDRLATLFESGSITRIRLEAEQQSLDELRGRLIEAGIELATNKANYAESRDKPLERDLALREQTLTELFALQQEQDQLATQLATLESQREELSIRAPVAGVIQAVDFPKTGEVIEAGSTLFELVGSNENLVAELRIGEADIGHIQVDDRVSLKLTTFDARRYGEITGRITSLSPNIVTDPTDGSTYFRGIVSLDSLTIGKGNLQRPVRVGMAGVAEVVTDQRSMMAYLAKPVYRSLESAFGER
ncbi:HlyD family type I secretion periplasmic adaptor subunit [uncultured Roseobacter sp.]|uniref:HlyD family type I secretion periplasmic adaptor subunit n=1 Tax=uncultured Roseobacter sp. TaxID=114847 RepID=UPI0026130A7C|nr:HlyD family type I secretion periplasmic adaptor subunit [uncultured Roseobacter sp.]